MGETRESATQSESHAAGNTMRPAAAARPAWLAQPPAWLVVWLPIITSLLSLVLSVSSILIASREPEVLLTLPDRIRIVQGGSFPYLYLQPTFYSTGQNDRIEVIPGMNLAVEPPDGRPAVEFEWNGSGEWSFSSGTLSFVYKADATPLLISPRTQQSPVGVFNGPADWAFAPGSYKMTLRAARAVAGEPLQAGFEVTVTAEVVEALNEARGAQFREVRIER